MSPKLAAAIKFAEAKFPDLRLGQLLLNAVPGHLDLYYLTDDELAIYVAELYEALASAPKSMSELRRLRALRSKV